MDVQKALSAVDLTESAKQERKYIHSMTEKYQADSLNRGLEAFVESAALDIPRNQRLNAVCPPMAKRHSFFQITKQFIRENHLIYTTKVI